MKKMYKRILFFVFAFAVSLNVFSSEASLQAQDIPELHMLVLQGDITVSGIKDSSVDGLILTAKIEGQDVGSIEISKGTTSSRYIALEIGPNAPLEGKTINLFIGNEKANESIPFGPTTPSGQYCPGCSWVLPLSKTLNLSFNSFPQATPTPVPASVAPAFISGNVIFGSILSAPSELTTIEAFIDGELVGTGSVLGPDFSITVDPGNENYLGKQVIFKIGGSDSKTTYSFVPDDFITEFKLFFPEYVAPTPTPTVVAPSAPTPIPEPTRTPTPIPEPTPTYTPTATPTPIGLGMSVDNSDSQIILEDSDSGGCNSRGGGAASLSLIVLSAVPLYVLNRRRKN